MVGIKIMLPYIGMVLQKFYRARDREWQWLVSCQFLTGKRLNNDKRQRQGVATYILSEWVCS